MNILTIVNKFCANNDFMPVELYSFNGGDVFVKYSDETSMEFHRFMTRLQHSTLRKSGLISLSVVSWSNYEIRIKRGK